MYMVYCGETTANFHGDFWAMSLNRKANRGRLGAN